MSSNTLLLLMGNNTQDRDWCQRGNCLGVDPDLFFPERGASTKEAKSVCFACEVRMECLEYAMRHGEKFGIWGGMSERERRRLRRARRQSRKVDTERQDQPTDFTAAIVPVPVARFDTAVEEKPKHVDTRDEDFQRRQTAARARARIMHGYTQYLAGCRCPICESAAIDEISPTTLPSPEAPMQFTHLDTTMRILQLLHKDKYDGVGSENEIARAVSDEVDDDLAKVRTTLSQMNENGDTTVRTWGTHQRHFSLALSDQGQAFAAECLSELTVAEVVADTISDIPEMTTHPKNISKALLVLQYLAQLPDGRLDGNGRGVIEEITGSTWHNVETLLWTMERKLQVIERTKESRKTVSIQLTAAGRAAAASEKMPDKPPAPSTAAVTDLVPLHPPAISEPTDRQTLASALLSEVAKFLGEKDDLEARLATMCAERDEACSRDTEQQARNVQLESDAEHSDAKLDGTLTELAEARAQIVAMTRERDQLRADVSFSKAKIVQLEQDASYSLARIGELEYEVAQRQAASPAFSNGAEAALARRIGS